MLVFLLKSSACLAIFLMFYKLFLEKERMHSFKRYYLLAVLVLALVIPSITFTDYIEVTAIPATIVPEETISAEPAMTVPENDTASEAYKARIDYWPMILWTVYAFGVLLFLLKFIFNLWKIVRNIRNNPKLKIDTLINVLLKDAVVPHTFLNYVFLNRQKFEAHEIPKHVLVHEATHAQQKHSLDVLFVELLQIVFWFNPLLYFAKKSIKLNHEFLADAAVLQQGSKTSEYQHILLTFASSANYKGNQPSMANAINYSSYSSIKKRFKVMKTQTSKKSILVRTLLVLPVLCILFYSFSETKVVQRKAATTFDTTITNELPNTYDFEQQSSGFAKASNRSVEIAGLVLDSESLQPLGKVEIYGSKGNLLSISDKRGYFRVLFDTLNQGGIKFEFSLQKKNYQPIVQKERWGDLSGKTKSAFYFGLKKKDSEALQFSELVINPSDLNYDAISTDFNKVKTRFEFRKKVEEVKRNNELVFLEIANGHYLVNNTGWIKIRSKNDLISVNDNRIVKASEINSIVERKDITGMTPLDITSANYAIYTIPVDHIVRPLQGAAKEQLSKYNRLAKKYNSQPKEERVIPAEDLKTLELIYRKMSEDQKADAQPFPECPDPKSSNQEGATKKQVGEYNTLAKTYNTMLAGTGNIRIKKSDVNRLEYLYGIMTDNQRSNAEPFPDFPEPPEPPAPPAPPSEPHLNDHQYAENRINDIIENQDPYDNGNNISLNFSKNPMNPPTYYKMEKNHSMIRTVDEVTNKNEDHWIVATGANRNSRDSTDSIPIPPVAPTLAVLENKDGYSKELLKSIDNYKMKNRTFEEAVSAYKKNQTGSRQALWNTYNEAMALYVAYYNLAHKEGNFVQPVPSYKQRTKTEKTNPPAPPFPPAPKSPLELLKELKKDNAKIILDGKEIGYEEAEKLFEENTFSHIKVRKKTGERTVLEVSTD